MAKSYYKEIDGKKYDAGILDAAAAAVEGNGDGRISKEDAAKLLDQVKDGNKYTDIEKHTVALLREKFKWTDAADEWFRTEIRKWAAERGAKGGNGGGKVDLALVKSLRQRTGAGIGDCKKALVEAEGDEEKAVEIIQKKGLAKVAKKAGAIAAEGVIHAYIHAGSRVGVLLELNCQTDFVARNEEFKQLSQEVSMHIASEKPEYVRAEDITDAAIAKQEEIFRGQLAEEAAQTGKEKPEKQIEGIIKGKLSKWKKGTVLLDQEFILSDDKKTVAAIVDELSAKLGEKISIRRFVRYELGEGIEKKKVDLAADVAATLAGAG